MDPSTREEIEFLRKEQKELDRRLHELALAVDRLGYELRNVSENAAHERKMVELRIEQALLKFEKRLRSEKLGNE